MQKRGLPRSCGRLPCSYPGLLTSRRKLWNHLKSSNDFSPLVNSFQPPAFLCTSSWFSSTLFSSLSSPLNSFQLVLAHLTSVPPVQFFSAQSKWHSCKLSCSGQLNSLSVRSWFQHSIVKSFSCHVLSFIQSYWAVGCYLWVQRSSTFGPQPGHVCLGFGKTCPLNMPGPQEWSFFAQKRSHKEAFAHGKLLRRGTCTERIGFTQRSVYTEKVLHRENCYTKEPLDKGSFTPSNVLHTEAFTQRSSYTERLLHRASLYTERLLHRDAFTQITYPEKLLQRKLCHREAVTQR